MSKTEFKKYMHIERYGNEPVLGIELGTVYVFPKLDGTNSSLWYSGLLVLGGSRNRLLSIDNDNQGFFNYCCNSKKHIDFFDKYPNLRLYGEWMVPHTIKNYRDDVWKKFFIFDVYNDETEQFLTYDTYKPMLEEFNLDYIAPLAIIKNAGYENFLHVLNQNTLYMKDGAGLGEGIVIKNYDYYNKHGNQIWAKIVSTEFKEKHHKEMGPPETEHTLLEEKIVEEFVTEALVQKNHAKINNEHNGWVSKYIPELFSRVYYDIITEEMWEIVKRYKDPMINFKTLRALTIAKIKRTMPEIF